MTAPELISLFNRTFGINPWPSTFEVDADTYANCVQFIFDKAYEYPGDIVQHVHGQKIKVISLGENNGLLFKGVELILQGYKR